jgi:tryptophan synthase beta subunit
MVAWFQSIIGLEARKQIMAKHGRMPDRSMPVLVVVQRHRDFPGVLDQRR